MNDFESLPCIDCITLPICKNKKGEYGGMVGRCILLRNYLMETEEKPMGDLDIQYSVIKLNQERYKEFIKYMGINNDDRT